MSDLFGNHIVGFPTRRLIVSHTCISVLVTSKNEEDPSRLLLIVIRVTAGILDK